jgi:hypothetical protein
MEHGEQIYNTKFKKNVLHNGDLYVDGVDFSISKELFSKQNINKVSSKITQLLQGIDSKNRKIIIPDKTIGSIMSTVYNNFNPVRSDMYSTYQTNSDLTQVNDQVINIITSDIKNNIGMEECNSKLSIWTTVLGDFNQHGLRQHSSIKIREKRPNPMLFNMNY